MLNIEVIASQGPSMFPQNHVLKGQMVAAFMAAYCPCASQ